MVYDVSFARPSLAESGTGAQFSYAACPVRLCRNWNPVCVLPVGTVQLMSTSPGLVPVVAVNAVGGDCGWAFAVAVATVPKVLAAVCARSSKL